MGPCTNRLHLKGETSMSLVQPLGVLTAQSCSASPDSVLAKLQPCMKCTHCFVTIKRRGGLDLKKKHLKNLSSKEKVDVGLNITR